MEVERKIPTMESPATYRILVSGRLDADWSDRVGGMTVTTTGGRDSPETTTLEGRLPDQAALTGVMNTLYEQHLPVLSVDCLEASGNREGG
jgi:hypothetical protein